MRGSGGQKHAFKSNHPGMRDGSPSEEQGEEEVWEDDSGQEEWEDEETGVHAPHEEAQLHKNPELSHGAIGQKVKSGVGAKFHSKEGPSKAHQFVETPLTQK